LYSGKHTLSYTYCTLSITYKSHAVGLANKRVQSLFFSSNQLLCSFIILNISCLYDILIVHCWSAGHGLCKQTFMIMIMKLHT